MFGRLLRRLFGSSSSEAPAHFLCSDCWETYGFDELHALPWWNPDERAFFMSTRCGECYPTSLEESRARVAQWDREAQEEFRAFLDTWRVEELLSGLADLPPQQQAIAVLDTIEASDGTLFRRVYLAGVG